MADQLIPEKKVVSSLIDLALPKLQDRVIQGLLKTLILSDTDYQKVFRFISK